MFVWVIHFSSNLRPELKLISSEPVRAGLPIAWAFALGIACQGLRFRRVEVAAEVAVAPSTSKVREMTLFLCLLPVLFLALRVLRITKSDWYSAPFSPELFFGAFAAALVGLLGIKQERFRGMAKTLAIAFLVSTLGVVLERRPFIQSYFFPLTGYFLLLVVFLAAQVETFRESPRWASLQNWPFFCLLGFWSYFCYFEGWVTEAFLRYHLGLLREEMAQTAVPDDLPQQIDHLASFENFLRSLRLRQTLCSKLAGEVMYAGALNHPICLKDASYFWFGGGFMVAGTPYPKAVGNPVQAINRDILQRRPIFIATSFLDDFLVAPSPDSPTLVSPEYAGYQRLQNNFLRKD